MLERPGGFTNGFQDVDLREAAMARFMDVHRGMKGITADELLEAHHCDIDIQDDEAVNFKQSWADPVAGVVFCLSEAPTAKAVETIHERAGSWVQEVYEVSIVL